MERDTHPEAAARYHAMLGALPSERRLAQAVRLSTAVRALCEAGIRERYPAAGAEEIRWRIAEVCYGGAIAERAFGPRPGSRR